MEAIGIYHPLAKKMGLFYSLLLFLFPSVAPLGPSRLIVLLKIAPSTRKPALHGIDHFQPAI